MDPLQKRGRISFRQGIKEHEVSDRSTIKKKTFSNTGSKFKDYKNLSG